MWYPILLRPLLFPGEVKKNVIFLVKTIRICNGVEGNICMKGS